MEIQRGQKIAICGRTGAGKSTASEYLVAHHSYSLVHPGKIGRDISRRLFDSESKTVLNQLNDALRTIDPNVLLRAALRESPLGSRVVVDGMRFKSNYDFLKKEGFQLWRIECSAPIRRARLVARGQLFDWERDAAHPSEQEIEELTFNVILFNDSSDKQDLFRQIDSALLILPPIS